MKNELAIIKHNGLPALVPEANELAEIMQELSGMDNIPYGRVKISAGGANVFQVTEAGDDPDNAESEKAIEGVIVMYHKTFGYWPNAYGATDDPSPVCASTDGELGTNRQTGETKSCSTCPYNQFGSKADGRGKACKNMYRLYIMRRGDVLPIVLTVPPTGIKAFDNYRVKTVMKDRKKLEAILTRITLKSDKNPDNIKYSVPVFETVGALAPDEAKAVSAFAASFRASAQRVAATAEDVDTAPATVYTKVEDDELPFDTAAPEHVEQTRLETL